MSSPSLLPIYKGTEGNRIICRRFEAVTKFLERNSLLTVIRGHEAQDAGYVCGSFFFS